MVYADIFFNVIESMYENVSYRVKVDGVLSTAIPSNVGVKQGCLVSPLLFNLFLSDLPDIFTTECDPVKIHNVSLNCLMFADDLVLMSESANGLQKCLSKLQHYCDTWSLKVNVSKTKVVSMPCLRVARRRQSNNCLGQFPQSSAGH